MLFVFVNKTLYQFKLGFYVMLERSHTAKFPLSSYVPVMRLIRNITKTINFNNLDILLIYKYPT